MAFTATECGFPEKVIPTLRRDVKKRQETDLLFYSLHFFWAESLLERGRYEKAIERYRYVLGEIEGPLYPLALYRTAHCYWEDGNVEKAREFLGHVIEWAGDQTDPPWVPAMQKRAKREFQDFDE
jgi:tetratricopeptide (TPR) repeat protein